MGFEGYLFKLGWIHLGRGAKVENLAPPARLIILMLFRLFILWKTCIANRNKRSSRILISFTNQ